MKLLNKFKKLVIAMMVLGVFLTVGNMKAYASDISSGIYEVENEVYHESETGMAMSRSYLLPTMTVEVTSEHIIYTVGFSGGEYMENYRMNLNGESTPIEIVQDGSEDGIVKLNIEVDKVDADMDALIYVTPMERDVQFKVIPKIETLTLIEEIVETTDEVVITDITSVENVNDESENHMTIEDNVDTAEKVEEVVIIEDENEVEKDSENSSSTKTIVIGSFIVLLLAVVGGTVVKAKNKSE